MRKSKTIRVLLTVFLCCFVFGAFTLAASAGAPETHTVSFWLGESVPYEGQDQEVADGGFAVVPVTPEKENAVFLRWTLEGGEGFSFRTPITTDLSLYAAWYELEAGTTLTQIYTVEFTVGDAVVSRQSVEEGRDAIAPTGFDCPAGKTFVGWVGDYTNVQNDLTVAATLTDTVYTVTILGPDDAVIDTQAIPHGGDADLSHLPAIEHYSIDGEHPYDGATTGIVSDGEIRVNYLPDVYDVRFFSDGAPFGATRQVAYGGNAAFPEIPAKENYIFIGWYLDLADSTMFDFNTPIGEDTDLYAKFIPIENKKYTVTFQNYDGSRYGGVQLIEEGKTAFVPGTPAREGYTFLGWCGEDGGAFDFSTPIESDRTITALFRIRTFTVTVMDGNTVVSEQSVKWGENAVEPEIPGKEGAIFAGFDGSFNDVRQDTVIRVRYIEKTFSVMFFDAQQKKIGGTQYVPFGGSATAPRIPVPEGYEFVGWSDAYDDVRDDLVLFPEFRRLGFTVRYFDGNEQIGSENVLYGDSAAGISPERDGYLFVGWRTEGDAPFDLTTPVTCDLDLSAAWAEKPPVVHTVTFMVDEAIYQTQTVADGAAAQNPANPAKYGYTFAGWDADFSSVSADLTVNALFDVKTYTVTFTANGATFDSAEVEHGSTVGVPSGVPTREGYGFVRWNFDFETPITEDLTVKAVFAINTYTVRFLIGDEVFSEQTVEYGDSAQVPATPQKVGATFVGWEYEDGTKFRFSHSVTGDLDVYARFETQTFPVVFMADGEIFATVEVEYGDTVDTPYGEPDKQGWTFLGWDFDFTTPIVRETTVYALFEEISYTVTFTVDGEVFATETVPEGATVPVPASPRKDGYRFVGWDFDFTTPITEDTTIAAQFEAFTYTVTYTVNGAFWHADAVAWGESAEEPEPADVEGYKFIGWNFDFTTPIKADTTIAAELEPIFCAVTFTVDGRAVSVAQVAYGGTVTAPAQNPEKEGFRFLGWDFDFTTPIKADTTIAARFEEIIVEPVTHTVIFTADGEVFATVEVADGGTVSAPERNPAKEGYRFVGWAFNFETPITGYTTIAARFEEIIVEPVTHTVIFTADGEVFATVEVADGGTVSAPERNPAKEGYRFVGWAFNFKTPITEDTTIVARFEEIVTQNNRFTLVWTENGDGTATVALRLSGNVCAAGFVGKLEIAKSSCTPQSVRETDDEQTRVYCVGNEIRFVWSNATNVTEEWTVFTVTFDTSAGRPVLGVTISEFYAVDEIGSVVSAEYVVD